MTETLDSVLAEIRTAEAAGLVLSAHDRAMTALADHPDNRILAHRAVLNLARAGATAMALELFQALGLGEEKDPEIAGLGARLFKDVALEAPPESREPLLRRAARRYAELWETSELGWHGVNAAALALLAGRREKAAQIAGALLGAHRDIGDYWSAATEAEALLIVGETEAAQRALARAEQRAGGDLAARATTRRQMRREIRVLGLDPAMLDALHVPATLHYCGHMPRPGDEAGPELALSARIRDVLSAEHVGAAFGGLAAGFDIMMAEALVARGVKPRVILPCPPADYARVSVAPSGERWMRRFEHILPLCELTVLDEPPFSGDDFHIAMASRRAMGLARLHARNLDGRAVQVAAWDGGAARGAAGTAADVAAWEAAGGRRIDLGWPWPRDTVTTDGPSGARRRLMAVLFGDLAGFGALDDSGLDAFYNGPLAAMGRATDDHAPAYRNCWGDAVQLAFTEVTRAADCAFALRAALASLAESGLPDTLAPRIALDFGPLLPVFDGVQRADKFAGRAMTRAARIEPVTPPRRIHCTEGFACEVALLPRRSGLRCDYAGRIPTAKGFGILPLYALRRAAVDDEA